VDSASGSRLAKERLKTVLHLIGGEITRQEAASRLGVSVRRVRQLRDEALAAALERLEPGRPGRPPKAEPSDEERELTLLEAQADMLAWELEVSRTREELALVMPHVVQRARGARGKARASRRGRPGGAAGRRTRRG
jgi:hypothetical protein